MKGLCALALALTAAAASAAVPDLRQVLGKSPNADLRAAVVAYDQLDFEGALTKLEGALTAGKLTRAEEAAAELYAGLIAHSLNYKPRAKAHFERAIALEPDIELPADAPPKTRLAFADAKQRLLPPGVDLSAKPPPSQGPGTAPVAATAPPPAQTEPKPPIYKRWWFWAGAGGVALAGVVAAVLIVNASGCGGPSGTGCLDVTVPKARPELP
jgi:tetratricopeptide (TPR) repeat protein